MSDSHLALPTSLSVGDIRAMKSHSSRRVILNFHGIGPPHRHVPESERPYWISEAMFRVILEQVLVSRAAGIDVRLTFDDGNISDLTIAAPAIADVGVTASFFLLTGRVGNADYVNEIAARELIGMGMEVGLHGRDHVDWRLLDDARLRAEVVDARKDLEDLIGAKVTSVAVPFGAYSRKVMHRILREGYCAVYTSDGGYARPNSRIRSRTSVRADMGPATIEDILFNREGYSKRLRRSISMFVRQHIA